MTFSKRFSSFRRPASGHAAQGPDVVDCGRANQEFEFPVRRFQPRTMAPGADSGSPSRRVRQIPDDVLIRTNRLHPASALLPKTIHRHQVGTRTRVAGEFGDASPPIEVGDGQHHGFPLGLGTGEANGIRQFILRNINRRFHEAILQTPSIRVAGSYYAHTDRCRYRCHAAYRHHIGERRVISLRPDFRSGAAAGSRARSLRLTYDFSNRSRVTRRLRYNRIPLLRGTAAKHDQMGKRQWSESP